MTAFLKLAPPADVIEWQLQGSCRGLIEDSTFFADRTSKKSTERAKRICANCPVIQQCAQYALDNVELYGVWGGLDRYERAAILGIAIVR